MDAKLTFQYDRDADTLHISTRTPYPGQESEELDDGVVARFNPATGEVENLEILFSQHGCSEVMPSSYRLPRT